MEMLRCHCNSVYNFNTSGITSIIQGLILLCIVLSFCLCCLELRKILILMGLSRFKQSLNLKKILIYGLLIFKVNLQLSQGDFFSTLI